jgi:hypothetical protein
VKYQDGKNMTEPRRTRGPFRRRGIAGVLAFAAAATIGASNLARAGEDKPNPPPVDTTTNPDAVILNAKNQLMINAGPGEPNVGSIYMPPSPSGKSKKGREGQTQSHDMGAATDEK